MGRAHGQDGRCSSFGKELQEHDALSRKGMHPYSEDCTMNDNKPKETFSELIERGKREGWLVVDNGYNEPVKYWSGRTQSREDYENQWGQEKIK